MCCCRFLLFPTRGSSPSPLNPEGNPHSTIHPSNIFAVKAISALVMQTMEQYKLVPVGFVLLNDLLPPPAPVEEEGFVRLGFPPGKALALESDNRRSK